MLRSVIPFLAAMAAFQSNVVFAFTHGSAGLSSKKSRTVLFTTKHGMRGRGLPFDRRKALEEIALGVAGSSVLPTVSNAAGKVSFVCSIYLVHRHRGLSL